MDSKVEILCKENGQELPCKYFGSLANEAAKVRFDAIEEDG